ncbi:MAG: hypothetical protein OQK98_12980 [Gammaproteobacteria bacterium]|nr:hypothetical protein [Gammaproteobacteria bacterium]
MSNNDKAKEKLMESMRMTKEGTNKKVEEAADTRQNKTPQDETPIKKKKKNTISKKISKDSQKTSADPFQSVSRVWPD